ncbi:formate dehydrogenase accessory sulfurtransferase FdhD [Ramlibacter sp. H39-3-26]|uniref:formate dehydrogenase accessory sulfurtransferase FdhD n=1 Tax=Curvibacter soli TaxID=3031331 RepID=UPI0023DA85BF|nr:formate dehydrogenase accessory sulfurtransferase FdhD [Ramlibacter sp. H39-3-26]MDF1484653.1 formate dehydrogenase accessory sulfurtransferase FdhD [Ramlibacter sp. H39-3-26]
MPPPDDSAPTGFALPPALETRRVAVHGGAHPGARADTVAAETPVALVFNGISHAVMMATPLDLEDFALGFALSEGILDGVDDCRGIEVRASAACADGLQGGLSACEVHLDISSRSFARLKDRRRSLAGRTGCGVCGIDSLGALDLVPERVRPRAWLAQVDRAAVLRAFAALPALQPLNARAGAVHAAGWAAPDGALSEVREDVGRHNALDKLLGHLAREGRLGEPGFAAMSSRASYELVRKCARLDVAALATISAPTGLAIRIAEQAGMRLWGLCRDPRAVLYVEGASVP